MFFSSINGKIFCRYMAHYMAAFADLNDILDRKISKFLLTHGLLWLHLHFD